MASSVNKNVANGNKTVQIFVLTAKFVNFANDESLSPYEW